MDVIVAEMLAGSAALHELMGKSDNLAGALNNLVALFLGKAPEGAEQGLAALTAHFAADDLPEAKTAIADRIIAEIKSNRRLCPDSMVDELKALRAIANRLVMGVGKYLSHEDLIAGFTLRSKRLVAQEALGQYIAEAAPDEKIERILFVEDNIIGAENKRQLSTYLPPVLNSAAFESHFQNPKKPLLARLQRLAQLQARMRRSGFIEVTRDEIATPHGRAGGADGSARQAVRIHRGAHHQSGGKGPDAAAPGRRRHPDRRRAVGAGARTDPGLSGQAGLSDRLYGGAGQGRQAGRQRSR